MLENNNNVPNFKVSEPKNIFPKKLQPKIEKWGDKTNVKFNFWADRLKKMIDKLL